MLTAFVASTYSARSSHRPPVPSTHEHMKGQGEMHRADDFGVTFASISTALLLLQGNQALLLPSPICYLQSRIRAYNTDRHSVGGRLHRIASSLRPAVVWLIAMAVDGAPMSFAAAMEKKTDSSPLKNVQLDGLAVLKILKHCKESMPSLVTGQLLGLDIGQTLEVTDCFPFPVSSTKHKRHSPDLQLFETQCGADKNRRGRRQRGRWGQLSAGNDALLERDQC